MQFQQERSQVIFLPGATLSHLLKISIKKPPEKSRLRFLIPIKKSTFYIKLIPIPTDGQNSIPLGSTDAIRL
jgi:hypothetical protein